MKTEEVALQIMLKLIELKNDDINKPFRSDPEQNGFAPEKVAEFYTKLVKSIRESFQNEGEE